MTAMMVRLDSRQLRLNVMANSACTVILLSGAFGEYEVERSTAADARHVSDQEGTQDAADIATRMSRHRKLDRLNAERLANRWFVINGLNFWPISLFVLIAAMLACQRCTHQQFTPAIIPTLLFFESATLATAMANDVRLFLVSSELSVIAMTILLARWGGPDRRNLATRFLVFQFSGQLFVAFGLAMVMIGLPWMKVDGSSSTPVISYKLSSIVFEVQNWMTNNQVAFQYVQEVFPFVLFTLGLGFAIQIGLFPFHSSSTSIVGQSPASISLIYVAGFVATTCATWYRVIFPIAPDILVRFDRLILVAAIFGSAWSLIRCVLRKTFSERTASVYLGLTSLSLLGTYSMSLVGVGSGWLFHQQALVLVCLMLTIFGAPRLFNSIPRDNSADPSAQNFSMQLLVMGITMVGFFGTSAGLLNELLRESVELSALVFSLIVATFILVASLIQQAIHHVPTNATMPQNDSHTMSRAMVGLMLIAMLLVSVAPQLLLMQAEPEFSRVFRQFEKVAPAASARLH